MRTIKFKALWTDGDSELLWVHGYVVEEDGAYVIYPGGEADGFIIPKEHENTIGQYTGLKDKNGQEIYEGDVVSDMWNNLYTPVFQNGIYMAYNPKHLTQNGPSTQFNVIWKDGCEIVGNIFENKELLEA